MIPNSFSVTDEMSQQDSFRCVLAKNLINAASEKFSDDNPASNKRKLLSLLHTSLIDEITDKKEIMTEAGRISYLESKNKEGKVIFLLHGNSACNEFFINQFLALGDQYHLFAVNLPGHGDSDNAIIPTDTYSFSGYARCINEIIAKLNISNCNVVGWSLGGHCALEMLRINPDIMDSILITGTPPLNFPDDISLAFNAPAQKDFDISVFCPTPFTLEQAERFNLIQGINADEAEFGVLATQRTDPMARSCLANSIMNFPLNQREVVENSSKPLTIVTCNRDQNIKNEYMKENFQHLPHVKLHELNAEHCVMWEIDSAKEFNELLRHSVESASLDLTSCNSKELSPLRA